MSRKNLLGVVSKALPISKIVVGTPSGYGSTATLVRHYTVTVSSIGADITFLSDATNGALFTINAKGAYSIHRADNSSAANVKGGITVNSSDGTTPYTSHAISNKLTSIGSEADGLHSSGSWTGILNAGDTVRPQDDSAAFSEAGAVNAWFTIERVR